MTRVSENSNAASIKYAINKVKKKMENLQLQGTTLKRISKPSDDPMSCFQGMQLKSVNLDNNQYLRSISYSLSQLNTTEKTHFAVKLPFVFHANFRVDIGRINRIDLQMNLAGPGP